MSNLFPPRLDSQKTSSRLHDVLNYQAMGMYDEQLRQQPASGFAFVSYPTFSFDQELYVQKRPDETLQWSEQILTLQLSYTLLSEATLIAEVLERVPALYPLLKEAVEPLRVSFGDKKILVLEALTSDDGTTLRVIVRLSEDTENPAARMRKFNQEWWVKNCSQSEASLVFDYEIGNGF